VSIADRPWYRDGEERRREASSPYPAGWILSLALFAAWVLQAVAEEERRGEVAFWLREHLALSLDGMRAGMAWQALTYMGLHGGAWHLLVNILVVFFFAGIVQEALGRRNAMLLFLATGVAGAAAWCAAAAAGMVSASAPVVGASGGAMGLLAFAVAREPRREVVLFHALPVPLWVLGALAVGMDLVRWVADPHGPVAVPAHLGGMAAGAAWALRGARRPRLLRGGGRAGAGAAAAARPLVPPSASDAEERARVDALLERIHARGIASLDDEEREFLQRVSRRLRGG
jgi:membrane associated rhomboid family serine protease